MAEYIRMEPEELRNRAKQIRQYATDHDAVIEHLTNLILALDEEWNGEAQTAFINRFQNARETFRNLDRLLEMLAQTMEISADKLQRADQSMGQQIRGLDYSA